MKPVLNPHYLPLFGVGVGSEVWKFVNSHIDFGHRRLVVDPPHRVDEIRGQISTLAHFQEGPLRGGIAQNDL